MLTCAFTGHRPSKLSYLRNADHPDYRRLSGMLGAVCLLPMLFDLFAQNALGRESTNIRRAVTGFAAGWGVLALCAQAAALLTVCLTGQ